MKDALPRPTSSNIMLSLAFDLSSRNSMGLFDSFTFFMSFLFISDIFGILIPCNSLESFCI